MNGSSMGMLNAVFKTIPYTMLLFMTLLSCAQSYSEENSNSTIEKFNSSSLPNMNRAFEYNVQKQKAIEFLKKNKSFNQELIFLLDMKRSSGNFRFFIHDVNSDSIIHKGLVAHGSGSVQNHSDSLIFSNTPDSYQSSLGKYRVGSKYSGSFGKSYKLHGLDSTNDNAFKRFIVLHPYSCVPDEEQEYEICLSLGCPMVSNNFMSTLYKIIDNSKKSILMIMYY